MSMSRQMMIISLYSIRIADEKISVVKERMRTARETPTLTLEVEMLHNLTSFIILDISRSNYQDKGPK
jgi:hypothetical protein